jgi:hypothetical protein
VFLTCGFGVYAIAGLWCLFLSLVLIAQAWGSIAALIGIFVLPGTLFIFPFYAGFAWGDWQLVMLTYGGTVVGTVLVGIGQAILDEPQH